MKKTEWEPFQNYLRRKLQNRKFREEYERLGPEFELISLMIEQRAKKGLTQAKLAKRMGTKQSAISRFESGTYNPTLAFLQKLARALGVKMRISFS